MPPAEGQIESVAASVVIAEEEGDESPVATAWREAVADTVIAPEPAPRVEPEHRERRQCEADAAPVAPDHRPVRALLEPRLADVGEQCALEFRKDYVADRGAQDQMAQQREAQLSISHPGLRPDDVAEVGIAAEPDRAADIHPPGTISVAIEAEQPRSEGRPPAQSKVAAHVAGEQEAVEPAVGEIARDTTCDGEAHAVDRAGRDPEGVVAHEAHVV